MPNITPFINKKQVNHLLGCIKRSNSWLHHIAIIKSFYPYYIIMNNPKLISSFTRKPNLLHSARRASYLIIFMEILPQYWCRLWMGQWLLKLFLQQATTVTLTRCRLQVSLDFIKLIRNMFESKDVVKKRYWWPNRSIIINIKCANKKTPGSRRPDKNSNSLYP